MAIPTPDRSRHFYNEMNVIGLWPQVSRKDVFERRHRAQMRLLIQVKFVHFVFEVNILQNRDLEDDKS